MSRKYSVKQTKTNVQCGLQAFRCRYERFCTSKNEIISRNVNRHPAAHRLWLHSPCFAISSAVCCEEGAQRMKVVVPQGYWEKLTTGSTQETHTQVAGMTDRHIYRTEHKKWLLVPGNNHKDHVASQTVCRRPLTAEARDRFQARQSMIFGGQSGTGTHFIPSTSICSSYYHYMNAPDTFIHLSPHIIYHLSQGVSKAKSKIAHTLQDVCSGRKQTYLGTPQPVARPKTKLS